MKSRLLKKCLAFLFAVLMIPLLPGITGAEGNTDETVRTAPASKTNPEELVHIFVEQETASVGDQISWTVIYPGYNPYRMSAYVICRDNEYDDDVEGFKASSTEIENTTEYNGKACRYTVTTVTGGRYYLHCVLLEYSMVEDTKAYDIFSTPVAVSGEPRPLHYEFTGTIPESVKAKQPAIYTIQVSNGFKPYAGGKVYPRGHIGENHQTTYLASTITMEPGYGEDEYQFTFTPEYEGEYEVQARFDDGQGFYIYKTVNLTVLEPDPEPEYPDKIPIDKKHFPDKRFREEDARAYDENRDGYLQLSERNMTDMYVLSDLSCNGSLYDNLTGIEYFHSLESLSMIGTGLRKLDISQNKELTLLILMENYITKLDLTGSTKLQECVLYDAPIQTLDVSRCTGLTELKIGKTELVCLDVSNCRNLTEFLMVENERTVTAPGGKIDLSSFAGFDVRRASGWKGGKVSGNILKVSKSGTVTYKYDCGNGYSAKFKLKVKVQDNDTLAYSVNKDGTAVCIGASGTPKKVTIPSTVTVDGKKYKVTAIADSAFKGNKKLTEVTIGNNVKEIGRDAFNGCVKLKKITIKTTKLTKSAVGTDCFRGIAAKAAFKCPKKMLKKYETWLRKTGGAPKTATFK